MNAAKLDRRISIYRPIKTQNSYGEITYADSLLAVVYAQVVPIGGRETFMASQIVPEAKFKIVIRYRSDLLTSDKIVFDGTAYDIAHIAEIGRREGLEVLVKFP
jgi:SPP1 family predicted phage head-tail adaptor